MPLDRDRPHQSLAVALAKAIAGALFLVLVVLTLLSRVAHAQASTTPSTPKPTAPATAAGPDADKDESVGGALKRSADRHGLWGSLGLGRGSAGLSCSTCAGETTKAYSLTGTIGLRVTPKFLVGVESFAWLDVVGGGVDRIARGTYLIARSYPFSSRVFVHGGLGVASFEVNDGEVAFSTRSPSMSLGLGFDWRLGGFTLTPAITAIMSTGGPLTSDRTNNAVTDNAQLGMLRTSVALSWFR